MRIDSHVFQIIMIGFIFLPVLIMFNLPSFVIFLMFFGLFCGAFYPDTDCPESRIFKMKQSNFSGTWRIVKMSNWDEEYCNMEVQAFINIKKSGAGEFQFGLVSGSMSGQVNIRSSYIAALHPAKINLKLGFCHKISKKCSS